MIFTVNKNSFESALMKAAKALAKKSSLPILENIKIQVVGEECILTATNLEQWVITKIPIISGSDMSFVLDSTADIIKAIKFFGNDAIEFDVDQDKNKVEIKCGSKSAKQNICKADFYPEAPVLSDIKETIAYNIDRLSNRYNKIKYAISKSDVKPLLQGIHFKNDDMVCIDGARMAVSSDGVLCFSEPFTAPKNALDIVISCLYGDINISTTNRHVKCEDSNTTVISRLLDGKYCEYQNLIPQIDNSVEIVVSEFKDSLKYLKVFAEKTNKGWYCVVWNKDTLLTVATKGIFRSQINMKGDFNDYIGFDLTYLTEMINSLDNDEATISLQSKIKPIIVKEEGFLHLLCPVNLSEEVVKVLSA